MDRETSGHGRPPETHSRTPLHAPPRERESRCSRESFRGHSGGTAEEWLLRPALSQPSARASSRTGQHAEPRSHQSASNRCRRSVDRAFVGSEGWSMLDSKCSAHVSLTQRGDPLHAQHAATAITQIRNPNPQSPIRQSAIRNLQSSIEVAPQLPRPLRAPQLLLRS
jgi:hypothetical protein